MKRAPLVFRFRDSVLVGTMHEPVAMGQPRDRIGLLLMNGGPVPRAGSGDLSAYLCDRLAELGVTGFRFDLPGLGESSGPSWREGDTFWRAAQRGFNDAAIAALVAHLCRQFGLRGIMIGGLCAGGVLSIRAATEVRDQLLGLVLLEPNLTASPPQSLAEKWSNLAWRLRSLDGILSMLTGKNRLAGLLRPIQPWLKKVAGRRTHPKLPASANAEVIARWRQLARGGLPSLVVVATDGEIDRYSNLVLATFPRASREIVRVVGIANSNHILLPEDSRERTGDALCAWVTECVADLSGRRVA